MKRIKFDIHRHYNVIVQEKIDPETKEVKAIEWTDFNSETAKKWIKEDDLEDIYKNAKFS